MVKYELLLLLVVFVDEERILCLLGLLEFPECNDEDRRSIEGSLKEGLFSEELMVLN